MKLRNKYYILRHGQALSNIKDIFACWPERFKDTLTREGKNQIKKAAQDLKQKNINLIFSSDMLRTRMTSDILGRTLKIKPILDKRLREQNLGALNGQPLEKIVEFFGPRGMNRFKTRAKNGEIYSETERRMANFVKDIDKKYKDKNILIVGHAFPLKLLVKWAKGVSNKDFYEMVISIKNGEFKELN